MRWEKRESAAPQEEAPKVCPEQQVSPVTRALPATGEMAGMASAVPRGWQEFLACLVPQGLPALLDSVSQPPVPCRLVSELLARGLTSDQFRAARLLQKPHLGKSLGEALPDTGAKLVCMTFQPGCTGPPGQSEQWCYSVSAFPFPLEGRQGVLSKRNLNSF